MIHTTVAEKNKIIKTLTGSVAINISLTEINEKMCAVEAMISGRMNGIQAVKAFADAANKIISSVAKEAEIPEPVMRQIFMMQFTERNHGTDA